MPRDPGSAPIELLAGDERQPGRAHTWILAVAPAVACHTHVGPHELDPGPVVGLLDLTPVPALRFCTMHCRPGVDPPAVRIASAFVLRAGAVAGEEEAAVLAQCQAPCRIDGIELVGLRRRPLGSIQLVHGVVTDVVAHAVGAIAGSMMTFEGVIPGVLLDRGRAHLEHRVGKPGRELAGCHHDRDIHPEPHRVDPAGLGAQHLDGPGRLRAAIPRCAAGAGLYGRARHGCQRRGDGERGQATKQQQSSGRAWDARRPTGALDGMRQWSASFPPGQRAAEAR